MPVIKRCQSCGKEFNVKPGEATTRLYCSMLCRDANKWKPVTKECRHCGKEFTVKASEADKRTSCSIACRDAAKPKKETICATCGKPFYAPASKKARYCSKECSPVGKSITKACVVCGKTFDVTRSKYGKEYCSLSCRGKAQQSRVKKTCEACGTEFEVKTSSGGQRTCSINCGGMLNRKEWLKKVCVVCNKPFEVYPSRTDAQCCSNECANIIRAENIKRRTMVECEQCGQEFEETNSHADRRRFCSSECRSQSDIYRKERSDRVVGELNPMWNGGFSRHNDGYIYKHVNNHPFAGKNNYVFEHRLVIEEKMRVEAPNHQFMINVFGIPYLRPEIEVHHIDMNRGNNDESNLLAVTNSTHKNIHAGNKPNPGTYWPENVTNFIT